MDRNLVPGTQGYEKVAEAFVKATQEIPFAVLHQYFFPFIPVRASCVLDIGAGIGRDAAALAAMGHKVIAVEPLAIFRTKGRQLYSSSAIEWIEDALPLLETLNDKAGSFDFILLSGVWHHLSEKEQVEGMQTISRLLSSGGRVAISLRHGPPGAGSHIFDVPAEQVIQMAIQSGLSAVFLKENLPSLVKKKEKVSWTKLVLQKKCK